MGRFTVDLIDPFICSHYVYAYASIDKTKSKITSLDPSYDVHENGCTGNYYKFNRLKTKNPKLKTLIAVGGFHQGSEVLSMVSSHYETRKKFVSSVILFLRKHKFDGLQIDWVSELINLTLLNILSHTV